MAANLIMDSLNVVGLKLNNPTKRCRLAKLILAEWADLVCFQETHLRVNDERYLKEV